MHLRLQQALEIEPAAAVQHDAGEVLYRRGGVARHRDRDSERQQRFDLGETDPDAGVRPNPPVLDSVQ